MTGSRRLSRQEAEDFLYREARLLDTGRLEEWLDLFAAAGIYWLPIDEEADPEVTPSVIYDDATQRAKRVFQLLGGAFHAQEPRSRTIHLISNIEVEDGVASGEATLRSNVIVYELRPGDHQELQVGLGSPRAMVGRCEYHMRYEQGRWVIGLKKVLLIDRDLPLHNLTFIL